MICQAGIVPNGRDFRINGLDDNMKRRLRIGYLNSYMVAPLLVAEHNRWLDELGWTLDPSMEIGWGPMMKGLLLGKLDGAVVPPCLPYSAATDDSGEAAPLSACAAMAFGGKRIVCNQRLEKVLESGKAPDRLRYASTGQLGCEAFYMKRWLRRLSRPDWAELLEAVPVAVTQNLNFLEAEVVDLFLCMEPWGRPESHRRNARILLSGDPLEQTLLSRVLVLRNDCFALDVGLLERLVPIIRRAADWLHDASNQVVLAEILSRSGCNLGEREVLSTLRADQSIPDQCGFSYLRPGSGDPLLTVEDVRHGWDLYSKGGFGEGLPDPMPGNASQLFRIQVGGDPLRRPKLA